ncbi:MAG: hypothetical protein EXS05_21495 [Planctomycetaceae bacterium]|nr:hypothetical protein [Planctomycetaceae bacterium]
MAVVTLDGKNHYLGPFGSSESKAKYAEKIAEWQRNRLAASVAAGATVYTVGQLAIDYLRFAQGWYVKNGEPTKQVGRIREALKALAEIYEHLSVAEFGPLKLRNVQQHFIGRGFSRNYINSLVGSDLLIWRNLLWHRVWIGGRC